jgi:hypothetical protein
MLRFFEAQCSSCPIRTVLAQLCAQGRQTGEAMIEQFGDVKIVVVNTPALGVSPRSGGGLTATSASPVATMEKLLAALATGFSGALAKVDDALKPEEVEIALSLSCSEELGAWIVGLKGEQAIEVTFRWNRNRKPA